MRINATFFNGAAILSQKGGLAVMSPQGLEEARQQVEFYQNNTKRLTRTLQELGFSTYGGIHSPYVWTKIEGLTSWQAFDFLLEKAHIITTPGSGFGPAGEGFLRISGFASKATIDEAIERLSQTLLNHH
jgi:LL-diaminopimelate aminotransferase